MKVLLRVDFAIICLFGNRGVFGRIWSRKLLHFTVKRMPFCTPVVLTLTPVCSRCCCRLRTPYSLTNSITRRLLTEFVFVALKSTAINMLTWLVSTLMQSLSLLFSYHREVPLVVKSIWLTNIIFLEYIVNINCFDFYVVQYVFHFLMFKVHSAGMLCKF